MNTSMWLIRLLAACIKLSDEKAIDLIQLIYIPLALDVHTHPSVHGIMRHKQINDHRSTSNDPDTKEESHSVSSFEPSGPPFLSMLFVRCAFVIGWLPWDLCPSPASVLHTKSSLSFSSHARHGVSWHLPKWIIVSNPIEAPLCQKLA